MQAEPVLKPNAAFMRRHRQRIRTQGFKEVLVTLPEAAAAYLDELKAKHGLPNRSEALLMLIEERRRGTKKRTA